MKRVKIESETVKTEDEATKVMVPPRNKTMENNIMYCYSPVPKRKVIKEKKGIVGALGGTTVLIPISPSSFTNSSSDKVKSDVNRRVPKAAADMAHPINMYDFRRYPKIG